MADLSGTRLGRLQIHEVIGTGGFCSVYRAYDEGLDTLVAVKVLAENHSFDVEARERFLAEGRLLRRVEDPAVLQVFDVGETASNQPYLVLQYAPGGSLADRLSSPDVVVDWRDLESLADVIAGALGALHDVGIVHRDVSPSNIFIAGDVSQPDDLEHRVIGDGERFVLGDLGLAKDVARSSGVTVGAGTPKFASPEQMHATASVGPVADVYGASALVEHMASGSRYENEIRRRVKPGLAEDPTDRPQDISSWRDQLGDFSELSSESSSSTQSATQPPGRRRQRPTMVGLALFTIGVGIFVAAMLISRPTNLDGDLVNSASSGDEAGQLVIFADGLGAGWFDASWSTVDNLDPDSGEIEVEEWGALSVERGEAQMVALSSSVLVELETIEPADPNQARIAVRINDEEGRQLKPCLVTGSNFSRVADGRIEVAVPLDELGSTNGGVSRVSVLAQGAGRLRFRLHRLWFGPTPSWVAADATCAER